MGTILFEMLTKRPPFNGTNHIHLLANIERQELRLPADVVVSNDCLALLRVSVHTTETQPAVHPTHRHSLTTLYHHYCNIRAS